MKYTLLTDTEYRAALYPGIIARIPRGTECMPAKNLDRAGFWVESWDDMPERAESWARNYGFLVDPSEVLAHGWRWVCSDATGCSVSAELYPSKGEAQWAGYKAHGRNAPIRILEDTEIAAMID